MDYETTQHETEVIQALNELLDKNMSDFEATLLGMTKEEIAEIDEITSTREIYTFAREFGFEPREAALLLRMENPLQFIVDNFPCYNLAELAKNALESGTIKDTGKEADAVREKPSVRGQLRAAAREVSQRPPPADRAKGGEAR